MPNRESVIYPHLENPPTPHTCTMCGLCCISVYELDKYYVEVEPEELPKLPKEFVRRFVGPEFGRHAIKAARATMRKGPLSGLTFKVCAALDGNPLAEAKCSIYERRPAVCRDFPMGGRCCTRIRREARSALMRGKPEEVEGCLCRPPMILGTPKTVGSR